MSRAKVSQALTDTHNMVNAMESNNMAKQQVLSFLQAHNAEILEINQDSVTVLEWLVNVDGSTKFEFRELPYSLAEAKAFMGY